MRARVWPIVFLLCVLTPSVRAQETCGDLDLDGDVDAFDAEILREELAASVPMTLDQALSCDVIAETRAPGLEPDPDDLASACSMADADVMIRNGEALLPAPAQVCALGAATDCCSASSGVGCNAVNTVECVCAQDPTCCTVDWDADCAALACGTACAPICRPGNDYCAGSCADLQADVANCGACGATCTNPHGTAACAAGACAPTCDSGWGSCDSNDQNGCETLFDTNPQCPGTNLGTIVGGDQDSVITRTGTGEAQFYVLMLDVAGGFSLDWISVQYRLTSPPGSNYNLRVTCFGCGSGPNFPYRETNAPAGAIDTLTAGAYENVGFPEANDSHYHVISVIYASGSACGEWSLEMRGDEGFPNPMCIGDL